MTIEQLFFELIRIAIGTQDSLSRLPSTEEWELLYAMAKKQSLIGICFSAVQKLTSNSDPITQNLDEVQYLRWMGMAAKIQQRNEVVNRQCVELQTKLAAEGFRSCVLKGQGVAQLYGEHLSLLRQSGDIDVWVDGGFEKVKAWAMAVSPTNKISRKHIHTHVFEDTEVELHYHPFNLTNPIYNRRLSQFFETIEDECFANMSVLGCCVPSARFNIVFLLVHIYHHLFTEGVGLRQVMDYYFVLRTSYDNDTIKTYDYVNLLCLINKLGLLRFAQALMYVLHSHFGLEDKYLLCEPDPEGGAFLLEEIMLSGNFGKQDSRQKGLYDSKWKSFWLVHGKTFRFRRFDTWGWFWSPISRINGYVWRKINGYE